MKTASHKHLSREEKIAAKNVFQGLGMRRVLRALTKTCKVTYKNEGWDNCFLTQAVGGKKKLEALQLKHEYIDGYGEEVLPDEDMAISEEFGIYLEDIQILINCFDHKQTRMVQGNPVPLPDGSYVQDVGDQHYALLSYARKWLRDRLRRAGKEIPYIAPHNIRGQASEFIL